MAPAPAPFARPGDALPRRRHLEQDPPRARLLTINGTGHTSSLGVHSPGAAKRTAAYLIRGVLPSRHVLPHPLPPFPLTVGFSPARHRDVGGHAAVTARGSLAEPLGWPPRSGTPTCRTEEPTHDDRSREHARSTLQRQPSGPLTWSAPTSSPLPS